MKSVAETLRAMEDQAFAEDVALIGECGTLADLLVCPEQSEDFAAGLASLVKTEYVLVADLPANLALSALVKERELRVRTSSFMARLAASQSMQLSEWGHDVAPDPAWGTPDAFVQHHFPEATLADSASALCNMLDTTFYDSLSPDDKQAYDRGVTALVTKYADTNSLDIWQMAEAGA